MRDKGNLMIWNTLFGKKKTEDNSQDTENLKTESLDEVSPENARETDDQHIKKDTLGNVPNATEQEPLPKIFKFDDEDISSNTTSEEQKSGFSRFLKGLASSKSIISNQLTQTFSGKKLSIETLDDLEDILLMADLGVATASMLRDKLEAERFGKETTPEEIKQFLSSEIESLLKPVEEIITIKRSAKPHVITFVGVNGSGKTTTIGKLAYRLKQEGLSVMLVAGDTYRAAATEQLTIWGERNGIPVASSGQGSDAAGLIYDAYADAEKQNIDVMLVDTAGRLQNKNNLMQELLKISRVLQKYDPDLPHETILVLDATTGQNAMRQAEIFRDIANISGIIMTKLDGSAKGGVLVSIGHIMKLPIYAIGLGENIEDLRPFNAEFFAKGLCG